MGMGMGRCKRRGGGIDYTGKRQTRDGTDVDDSPDRDGYGLRGNKLSRRLRRSRTSHSYSTARTQRRRMYDRLILELQRLINVVDLINSSAQKLMSRFCVLFTVKCETCAGLRLRLISYTYTVVPECIMIAAICGWFHKQTCS